jgi:hypothetical protein
MPGASTSTRQMTGINQRREYGIGKVYHGIVKNEVQVKVELEIQFKTAPWRRGLLIGAAYL